jgi:hypothetical protein
LLGVVRGVRDLGTASIDMIGTTAGSLVSETAKVGGNLGITAKGAVEGAIAGAKEIGVDTAAAASAAANGALKAAGSVGTTAVDEIKRTLTGTIAGVKVVLKEPFTQTA